MSRAANRRLNGENPGGGIAPEDRRHFLILIVLGISAKFVHVVPFAPEVEFFLGPCDKFLGGRDNPEQAAQAQDSDRMDGEFQRGDVRLKVADDRRTPDFYGNFFAAQHRHMHLADGSGGNRLNIEGVENLPGRAPKIFHEGPFHFGIIEGRDPIEQTEQRGAVIQGKQVRLHGQHLPELDKGSADLLNGQAKTFGPRNIFSRQTAGNRRPPGKPPLERVLKQVAQGDDEDVLTPPQACFRLHRSSGRRSIRKRRIAAAPASRPRRFAFASALRG